MNLIEKNKDKILELCTKHNVKQLYVFGSVLTDDFNDSSDIDMLIQFGHIELLNYFDNYMDLKEDLEKILNRPIDLIEDQAIRNPVFRKIVDSEKKLIYDRKSA